MACKYVFSKSQLLQPNPGLRRFRLTTQIELAISSFGDRQFNEVIDRLEGILGTDDEDIARDDWLRVTPQCYLVRAHVSKGRTNDAIKLFEELW